mmetsp:Transcript_22624/g.58980  ORF Transcript_22624/g.58980 Transcript_22624/m.58980 type:complete len:213 (+) Transcript_22624:839-1477(+)
MLSSASSSPSRMRSSSASRNVCLLLSNSTTRWSILANFSSSCAILSALRATALASRSAMRSLVVLCSSSISSLTSASMASISSLARIASRSYTLSVRLFSISDFCTSLFCASSSASAAAILSSTRARFCLCMSALSSTPAASADNKSISAWSDASSSSYSLQISANSSRSCWMASRRRANSASIVATARSKSSLGLPIRPLTSACSSAMRAW